MISSHEYVTEQLSIIVGAPVTPTPGQVKRVWSALSREEEQHLPTDTHGKIAAKDLLLSRLGLLQQPPLHDEIARLTRNQRNALPRWPHGHRFAACLTHDVDCIVSMSGRERFRRLVRCAGMAPASQMLRWGFSAGAYAIGETLGLSDMATYDYWMSEEARRGFHSTFFVLPEYLASPSLYDHFISYHDPVRFRGHRMPFAEATRHAHAEGWEIGLHGSYASAFDALLLHAERAQLVDMLGAPVHSIRQHYLRFNAAITPRQQAQAGFRADTTLGFGTDIGCRAGLAFPYFWPDEDQLLEVPLIIQDIGLLRKKTAQPDLPTAILQAKTLIEHIADVGGVVTLGWHTHPDSHGAHLAYQILLDTITDLGGWGCSLSELDRWWRARREAVRAMHEAQDTSCTAENGKQSRRAA